MSTREDVKNIMAYMAMCFPNYHPVLEGKVNAVDVMLDLLADMPIETLQVAVKACCAEPGRAFAPSVGEIRGAAATMHAQAAGLPTSAEAWGAIMESFRHTSFDQPALLQHPLLKEAIRCMGGLEIIGQSENSMAERAHFLKIYQQLYDRTLSDAAQLPQVKEYIQSARLVDGQIKTLAGRLSHPTPALPVPFQPTPLSSKRGLGG